MPVVVCCSASPSGPGRSHDSGVPMRSPRRSLRLAKPRTKSGAAPGGQVSTAGAGPASGVDVGVGFDAVFDATAAVVAATGTADKRGEAGVAQAVAASNDTSASKWYGFTDQSAQGMWADSGCTWVGGSDQSSVGCGRVVAAPTTAQAVAN